MQFASGATLTLLHEDGAVVKNCSFSGSPAIALTLDSSQVVLVVDNAFNLSGPTTAIEVRNATSATGLTLDSNTVNAGASGTGVKVIKSPGNALNVSLQGNDYHGSGVGIAVIGDGTTAGTIDAGGGSLGSQGANNFRSFTSGGTASGGFAIEVANTGLAFVLSARNNLFSASNPATVVKDATHNTAVGGGLNGTGSVDVGATQRTAAESFVETLYHNFLGRVADAAGLANWQGLVQTQGTLFVASNIIHSTEAETRLVDAAYLKYLDRTADAGGAAGWVNFLQQGGTEEQVVAGLLGSTEFANRANGLIASGNPDTNFVQAVYSLLLGRSASSAEVQNWVNAIPSIGRNGVALKILGSTEYRQDATGQYYLSYLHRAASAADESAWAGSTYDLLSIKANITSSGEYFVNG
jgi:hypothetical protein